MAAQGTGHDAAPLGSLAGTILVKTERIRDVQIDPVRRLARVGAGVVWIEVVHAAAEGSCICHSQDTPRRCTGIALPPLGQAHGT